MPFKLVIRLFTLITFSLIISACKNNKVEQNNSLFQIIPADSSGVHFANKLTEDIILNYFTYPYMYFGGGAAVGDINNDGLEDLFLTGNMADSKLYLNQGSLKFTDHTINANLDLAGKWITGVSMADINNDGWLDIYLCVSGKDFSEMNQYYSRENLLYINQGDGTFQESAAKAGLNDPSMSVQASFFDYDLDGDLDMYLANYPEAKLNATNDFWIQKVSDPNMEESDRFYKNQGDGTFLDVTEEAGILNYGLSLGLVTADFDKDGWMDIYVSNDFNSPDYYYHNNGDGTFTNKIRSSFRQMSNYGMGIDVADFNNDTYPDIIQLDMLPDNHYDEKINMGPMNQSEFYKAVDLGLNYQYMHNTVQLNNGNGTFSQVSNITGLSKTDWSWGVLFFDADNDGLKDVYISNGIRRSVNNNDFNKQLYLAQLSEKVTNDNILDYISKIPEEPKENRMFKNLGDLKFENAEQWGLNYKSYSNGFVYADFDNDGDLDVVVNNIDTLATVFRNNSKPGNYLKIQLKGKEDNLFGIGSKIHVYTKGNVQFQEVAPVRGFQSSLSTTMHFGLSDNKKVDSVIVIWPSGSISKLYDQSSNTSVTINQSEAEELELGTQDLSDKTQLFKELPITKLNHRADNFTDFGIQALLPFQLSLSGPALAVGDIDNNGEEDLFIGNGAGISSQIYLQNNGKFTLLSTDLLMEDAAAQDVKAEFLDVDNDGDLDLFVASGGYKYPKNHENYRDRIYINENGKFIKRFKTKSNVSSSDFTYFINPLDKKLTFLIGERLTPHQYPTGGSLLAETFDSKSGFNTQELPKEMANCGMVTAISINQISENLLQVAIARDWNSPMLWRYKEGKWEDITPEKLKGMSGLWRSVAFAEINGDGKKDIVWGNYGLNYKYQPDSLNPIKLFANNYDQDPEFEIIMTNSENGVDYPVKPRKDLVNEIPFIGGITPNHQSYAEANIKTLLTDQQLSNSTILVANELQSMVWVSKNETYEYLALPRESQISAVNAILPFDKDGDGLEEILIGGNDYGIEVEISRLDASYGQFLKNTNGNLEFMPTTDTGLHFNGQINELKLITILGKQVILVGSFDGKIQAYTF